MSTLLLSVLLWATVRAW